MGNLAKGFDCIEELIKLFLRYKTYMRWNMVCTKGRWGGLTERNRWDKPIKVTIIISMNLLYCWKAFPPGLETSRRETDVDKKNLTNMCGLVFTQKLGFSSNTNQTGRLGACAWCFAIIYASIWFIRSSIVSVCNTESWDSSLTGFGGTHKWFGYLKMCQRNYYYSMSLFY
ncbi:hypothetical protein YC2023_075169 [Brassica napus]